MFSKTVKTRVSKDDKSPTETKVTLDFSGVSEDEMATLAAATVIINEQAIWRISRAIPEECTISVRAQLDRPRGSGFKLTPEGLAKKASANEETYRQTLEALGIDEDVIEEMVARKFG